MRTTRFILIATLLLAIPFTTLAAPAANFLGARSLLSASSSPGNAYAAGATVTITAPTGADLSAVGGTVTLASPVEGDALLLGGSVNAHTQIAGDLRSVAGTANLGETVAGDVVAIGFSIQDDALAKGSTFLAGIDVSMTSGAEGPVTIYGNTVSLAGHFTGDVNVVSSGHITLAASTTIDGVLSYNAPETAAIPDTAIILGGVSYTNTSYLPSAGTSRALALASIGIFLLARVLGALILAGLLAGLFPRLAELVTERAWGGSARTVLLTMLLGFAVLVATPILLVLLALTFVGFGIALMLFLAYGLLVVLSFIYAGIMLGSCVARQFEHRSVVRWRDGVLGMLVLSVAVLVPVVGPLLLFLLMVFAGGALLLLFFHLAFPHDDLGL